ncbi:hypothetical protein N5923_10565 [Erwiniaceae bacterium BAC15a-03b]|uniref:Uncharacterized protein n=1 Tax=Winslowiella arboricola TaxID=2978220 RepID=A0A9J6PKN9_9GAMM|nr:hypothetical protein [Winslowiella arboricola]MCU5774660.1 hypothetical protein [Winslowiella arboricola]MCU5777930.1 hypothetical protein [Winslowiella arboricola]
MKKHPHKEIQAAIDHAVASGWIIVECSSKAHPFCKIRCGLAGHTEHMHSIWSTPKNPEHFARQIIRYVNKCLPEQWNTQTKFF